MLNDIRHKLNNKWRTETSAVLVIVMSMVVMTFNSTASSSVMAAVDAVNVAGGQKMRVLCSGSRVNMTRVSATEVIANCIALAVSPTATNTPTPTATKTPTNAPTTAVTNTPTSTPVPGTGGGTVSSGDSMAMNAWSATGKNKPNPKYDKCDDGTDIVRAHKAFSVIGPDGKRYPTWHAPVVTNPITGVGKCYFGHEHGRDPKQAQVWKTKQIQNYFYFDANKNGVMDASEEAVTGIPFGYVNEQMDLAGGVMRHEDHVGHKVEWANGEPDLATHNMSSQANGGVWIGKLGDGVMAKDTGVRCFFLAKAHQGTSSGDALTNNLHEVMYFADCTHPTNSALNQKISLAVMEGFGKVGGFTKFMPLCGVGRRNSAQDFVFIGTNSENSAYPSGDGDREIPTRDCIESGFLVNSPSFSGNLYEAWPASLKIVDRSGKELISGIDLLFDVNDANRYFYPETLKAQRGYSNPDAGLNVGYSMDLCYENLGGKIARHNQCDAATNYGQIKGITWNDPRSAFRGLNRGMYFKPANVDNAGGAGVVYTDIYGYKASTTPFTGSIKQIIPTKSINLNAVINDSIDPRITMRYHSDGDGTVHAPN